MNYILIIIGVVAGYTHLYTCFTDERWGMLIIGLLLPPIGIINGLGIMLGFW